MSHFSNDNGKNYSFPHTCKHINIDKKTKIALIISKSNSLFKSCYHNCVKSQFTLKKTKDAVKTRSKLQPKQT